MAAKHKITSNKSKTISCSYILTTDTELASYTVRAKSANIWHSALLD